MLPGNDVNAGSLHSANDACNSNLFYFRCTATKDADLPSINQSQREMLPIQSMSLAHAHLTLPAPPLRPYIFCCSATTTSDMMCQFMEADSHDDTWHWDIPRTGRIAATGAFVLTPLSIGWNTLAERLFPGPHVKSMLGKLGVQLVRLLCLPIYASIVFKQWSGPSGQGVQLVSTCFCLAQCLTRHSSLH